MGDLDAIKSLKSLFLGIFSGLIFFTILSAVNQPFWGATLGFLLSGAVMTILKGKHEKVSIYFKMVPGAVMGLFILIYIIFTGQYYIYSKPEGLFLIFIIYLSALGICGLS